MKTVVITGGIGSGKSTVCRFLSESGVPVYDSDTRAKALYSEKPQLVKEIAGALGTEILKSDGSPDFGKLASIVFADPDCLKTLEAIVHPAVLNDFNEWKLREEENFDPGRWKTGNVPFVVFESAIILEKPFFNGFGDMRVLIDAPVGTRLKRAAERDGIPESSVRARMERQKLLNDISEGKVSADVDRMIVNDSDADSLRKKVSSVFADFFYLCPRFF